MPIGECCKFDLQVFRVSEVLSGALRFAQFGTFFGTLPDFGVAGLGRVGADADRVASEVDGQTTTKYLHYVPRAENAQLVADAFRTAEPVTART
jgi:hypothetical protein